MAAAVGLVLGIATSRFVLVGSPLSLIPWAVAGLALGAAGPDRRAGIRAGAVYGFVLTVSFMIGGRQGDLSAQLPSFVPLTVLLGVVGGACGAVLAILGRVAKVRPSIRRRPVAK